MAVRIGEIRETTDTDSWYWINGCNNIADWFTRGKNPEELDEKSTWQAGPGFVKTHIRLLEESKVVNISLIQQIDNVASKMKIDGYSKYKKLIQVTARVIQVFRSIPQTSLKNVFKFPSADSFEKAEIFCVKDAQQLLKDGLERGDYARLCPKTTGEGIYVVARLCPQTTGEGIYVVARLCPQTTAEGIYVVARLCPQTTAEGISVVARLCPQTTGEGIYVVARLCPQTTGEGIYVVARLCPKTTGEGIYVVARLCPKTTGEGIYVVARLCPQTTGEGIYVVARLCPKTTGEGIYVVARLCPKTTGEGIYVVARLCPQTTAEGIYVVARLCPQTTGEGIYVVSGRMEEWFEDTYNSDGLILLPRSFFLFICI